MARRLLVRGRHAANEDWLMTADVQLGPDENWNESLALIWLVASFRKWYPDVEVHIYTGELPPL